MCKTEQYLDDETRYAAERRIVNPQSLPVLDVPDLLELIHEVTDAAARCANQYPECPMRRRVMWRPQRPCF